MLLESVGGDAECTAMVADSLAQLALMAPEDTLPWLQVCATSDNNA